jgi:hypothetical protein
MARAIALPLLDYLIGQRGEHTELGDLAGDEMYGALLTMLGRVWDGTIEVDVWLEHTLNPWPMPPYPG